MNGLMYLSFPFSASVTATVTAIKNGPGQVFGWQIVNNTGAIAYAQMFNKKASDVTVGTTIPDYVVPLPANGGAVMPVSRTGINHSTGISIACTTTRTGNTSATCDVVMFFN